METRERVIVGVFDAAGDARRAIEDLRDAHFSDQKIGVLARGDDGNPEVRSFRDLEGNRAGTGALVGVAAGASSGALWALGIATGVIPAIGPVIAGGTLVAVAVTAAAGAAAGVVVGTLVGLGIPDEEAAYYEDELREGRTIVVADPDRRGHLVQTIFRANNAKDGRLVTRPTLAEHINAPASVP